MKENTRPKLPAREASPDRRLVLGSIALFWCGYYFLFTLRAWLLDFQMDTFEPKRGAMALLGVILSFVCWAILDRFRRMSIPACIGLALVIGAPSALLFASGNWFVFYGWLPDPQQQADVAKWGYWPVFRYSTIDAGFNWYFFFAAWGVCYVALLAMARIDANYRIALLAQAAAHEARLSALRLQLDPHFLFNGLNVLASLVMEDRKAEADRMILDLAALMRFMLADHRAATVSLSQEFDFLRSYLSVETARFEGRMRFSADMEKDLGTVEIPAMLLQPLIENAVRHGVAPSNAPVSIDLRAERVDQGLRIVVETRGGSGFGAASPGHGLGHANVAERLALVYSDSAQFDAGPTPLGYQAQITLPIGVSDG